MDTNNGSQTLNEASQALLSACRTLHDLAEKLKAESSKAPADEPLRQMAAKLDQARLEARNALILIHKQINPAAEITPELRQRALQELDEEQVAAGVREIRQTGGRQLNDFIGELEEACHG